MPLYQSVKYAFTITLQSKMFKYTPQEQYDHTYLELCKRLKALGTTLTVIAELTLNANIHYHGVIQFHVKSKSHLVDFKNCFRTSKIFGYSVLKQIEDEAGWSEYVLKNVRETTMTINRPAIIVDEMEIEKTNYFDDLVRRTDIIYEQ